MNLNKEFQILKKVKIIKEEVKMKAIKIELILVNSIDTEHFITQVLPKLKKEYKMKQVNWQNCEYFEK